MTARENKRHKDKIMTSHQKFLKMAPGIDRKLLQETKLFHWKIT